MVINCDFTTEFKSCYVLYIMNNYQGSDIAKDRRGAENVYHASENNTLAFRFRVYL